MNYSIDTFKSTIAQLSDEELLRRWHLKMFVDEAVPVAEAEAERRGLVLTAQAAQESIAKGDAKVAARRETAFISTITVLLVAAGASVLGLIGGIIFLVAGHWAASIVAEKASTPLMRWSLGAGLFLAALLAAGVLRGILGGGSGATA